MADPKPTRGARDILLSEVKISFATLIVLGGILAAILEARFTIKSEVAVLRADLNAQQTTASTHATAKDLDALRQVMSLQITVLERQLEVVDNRIAKLESKP